MEPDHDNTITPIAQTNFRGATRPFGIKKEDRRHHMYIIGKTGVGKSSLLTSLISHDIISGEGCCILDPHGDSMDVLLPLVKKYRASDSVYFNVPDTVKPLGFNPLENIAPIKRPLAASGILEAFKKLWPEFWGPRLEHILRNSLLALLDIPFSNLADILRLFDDIRFRKQIIPYIRNAQVKAFWAKEFEGYSIRFRNEAIAPIQNKVGAFLADPRLYAILTQRTSSFNLKTIMDSGQVLLVNLSKGLLGSDAAHLMGALLVSQIALHGLSRAEQPEEQRRDFYLYLDEFQNVATGSLAGMLSELRKYRVNMVLANQYLSQLSDEVKDAILGNVGTLISFRVGTSDAELLAKEFYPVFSQDDLINLPNHHVYLKMMVDGIITTPFSAELFPIKSA